MPRRNALIPTLLVSMAFAHPALAQTTGPTETAPGSPCQVTPGEPQDDGSLTDTLDDCNGVLQPPAVGDPGMVEQAPDVGETPVIPPSAVPEQPKSDDDDAEAAPGADETARDSAATYSTGQIVDAIGNAGAMADRFDPGAAETVEVRDISILFDGVDAAVINASLAAHAGDVERLRDAIGKDSRLTDALDEKGLAPAGVVAAETDASGSLIIFAR